MPEVSVSTSFETERLGDRDRTRLSRLARLQTSTITTDQRAATVLVTPDTQALIGEFGVERFGQPLFFPAVDRTGEELGVD